MLIAGVFLGTYVLVRITSPSDYGLTLHPELDKVWSMWRMVITAGWLALALLLAAFVPRPAAYQSFSYAAASTTAAGLVTLAIVFPQSSSVAAVLGSLAVYAATSGALCLSVKRPIPAAILGVLLFVLQVAVDGVVHFLTGVFRIH